MERLTATHGGMIVPRKACTFDREGGADDCKECTEICEYEGGVCRTCILQECLTKLGKYEDTGLAPEQITELEERNTPKIPIYQVQGDESYEQEPEWWECQNCGEIYDMDEDHDFCPNCGQMLMR